jgi:hypothetical protein
VRGAPQLLVGTIAFSTQGVGVDASGFCPTARFEHEYNRNLNVLLFRNFLMLIICYAENILSRDSLQTEFGAVIGFIETLQNLTTNYYSDTANSHILQLTTSRTKTFQPAVSSPVVAW